METPQQFLNVLRQGIEDGGFETDDVIALTLSLFREVATAHEAGLIAPLEGVGAILQGETGALRFASNEFSQPTRNLGQVETLLAPQSRALEVIGESRRTTHLEEGTQVSSRLDVAPSGEKIIRPVYLPNYICWEQSVGHHDPITDIFSLGLLLASFACNLDFTRFEDVETFAQHRANLFGLNPRIHPVIARVIVQMTELNRHKRAPDLAQVIRTLETHRDQPVDLDVSKLKASNVAERRRLIHENLRDRLFEISRRNRLIHFKNTLQTLNLSVASVPLVMDVKNIRFEQLFVWHAELAAALSQGQAISLGKYLRIEDAPYIPGVLDKIISEARRDRAEYGFAQLRLVLCFLRWHNLKDVAEERIHSPLLLLPVELVKRKGVRDAYVLTPSVTEAEVNPALRHHLKVLYGIHLPETVDLEETTLQEFHALLQEQIRVSEPGVTLERIDRPRIELIHAKARQRLDQWRRRQSNRPARSKATHDVAYSYGAENYQPKGLQLFLERIRPEPFPLSNTVGAAPRPRLPHFSNPLHTPRNARLSGEFLHSKFNDEKSTDENKAADGPTLEKEQRQFALQTGESETGNPYHWSFDLCSLTLGNFHYRKMTLVRDYNRLAEEGMASPSFDAVFSLDPKRTDETEPKPFPIREQFPVISCDAAQAAAVARAREGASFIIQGPPGTGKSQTITNLIADYVAQGKRVLFVCEKRAAIDVVFYRLRQQGLDELCCLIHDSQSDKKAYILNLKQTYEQWLAEPLDEKAIRVRDDALSTIENELAALDRFSRAMTMTSPTAAISTRQLIHRLVETAGTCPEYPPAFEEILPDYSLWLSHGALAQRLQHTLTALGQETVYARQPLHWLSREVILASRPLEQLEKLLDEITPRLDAVQNGLKFSGLPEEFWDTLPEIEAILDYALRVRPVAERDQLELLNPVSSLSKQLERDVREIAEADQRLENAKKETLFWRDRLSETDTTIALENARKWESSFLRFLKPAFWRLHKSLHTRYDFTAHAVAPSLTRVLQNLAAEQHAAQARSALVTTFSQIYGEPVPGTFVSVIARARGSDGSLSPAAAAFRRWLLESSKTIAVVSSLAELNESFSRLKSSLHQLLQSSDSFGLESLRGVLTSIRSSAKFLPDLVPVLSELMEAPEAFRHAVLHAELPLEKFEAASASKTLHGIYRKDPALERFDGRILAAHRAGLDEHHRDFLKSNAAVIRSRVRKKFRENVQISNLPAAQLTEEQKQFKKTYASGRRDLEHEFGKTMRYRSIRDLAAGATGEVIRDLKPIWLMSPLSVSDTLPLDAEAFDVVIYDEASQIPVEEAVPAAYRARQVIVVGDEMQLPPTTFFSSSRGDDDHVDAEIEGAQIEVDLDADSFLTQAARNLPSTLLAWHYRSRYESLISFSNAAFYGGNLFTIPDRHLPQPQARELRVKSSEEGATNVDALLQRSISFHLLENGLYEQRRNLPEAKYLAETVRELLRRDTKLSIGIVAFSEAQQSEIERALDTLADEDKEFGARLEAEVTREENDQFCGLFVKNLESVQGDERDIILLSICYGYDREKRMLMNFGPINQRGGEKRLNVIFSRARLHMAVVTSIRHDDITNDYNDGANALRNFLRYAESLSRGEATAARSVLENLNPLNRRTLTPAGIRDGVVERLGMALRERGHAVDLQVGQSRFRCDLAIKSTQENVYHLGILVDTDAHYENRDLLDRYFTRPAILKTFGWQVLMVLTKDWLHEPEAVLARIERVLRGD